MVTSLPINAHCVTVVGGGLAGSEAAYQLLKRGVSVRMVEMRPKKLTPAHKTGDFAELVCSNSLKSLAPDTASGQLKEEMRLLDSLILRAAEQSSVPAGSALAVDRALFSGYIKQELERFEGFSVINEEYLAADFTTPTVIACGPLTSDALMKDLRARFGEVNLSFFDAASPIISAESIDYNHAFYAARYGKGDADYLNLPMNKEEYLTFYNALIEAETVPLKGFELSVFEGCMPIEVMAKRGEDAMRFGPLRPVGLYDENDKRYYAVVQLRKENTAATTFNIVGFQTNLTFPEQRRVFGLIPALKNAEFLRYGVMHRNSFLNSPKLLNATFRLKDTPCFYFAGQLTGVEGYMESAVSGLLAGINLYNELAKLPPFVPPESTVCGALARYVATQNADFQPMNANFGVLPPLEAPSRDKKQRKMQYYTRGVEALRKALSEE